MKNDMHLLVIMTFMLIITVYDKSIYVKSSNNPSKSPPPPRHSFISPNSLPSSAPSFKYSSWREGIGKGIAVRGGEGGFEDFVEGKINNKKWQGGGERRQRA